MTPLLLPHCLQLLFQEDLEITHMYSAEGEEVQLSFSIYPSSNVEDWLQEVEHSMKASVHDIIERAIRAYPTVSLPQPMQSSAPAPLCFLSVLSCSSRPRPEAAAMRALGSQEGL